MVKIGPAFGDYIRLEKSQRHQSFGKTYEARGFLLPVILVTALVLILARLIFLQVLKGSDYRALSDNNRTKTIAIHAPRGIIFDRDGIPLVFNAPGFREVPGDTSSSTDTDINVKLIDKNQALKFISAGKTNLEIDSLRNYPYKELFAHVLGYIGQISRDELEQKEFSGYKGGDLIGKIGIEREYERLLRGINGKELVEINSMGRTIRKLGQTDPIPGQNITLTLDVALQKAAFDAAKDIKKGAVIASNPFGEILAFVSKPSFDSNLFTMGEGYIVSEEMEYKNIGQILSDSENQPLLNRAIGGTYPPGSTFKLITAAAGLEEKVIDKNFTVEDTGILRVGAFSFGNWYFMQYGKTEQERVNVVRGIKRSNDIFFYKVAELVGVDNLSKFAVKFGLGNKLGIDLPGEEKGLVPTPNWKKRTIGENWYLGDTYHYGIGQGYLLVTPLQVNMWTSVIANDGILYQPRLIKNTTNTTNKSSTFFLRGIEPTQKKKPPNPRSKLRGFKKVLDKPIRKNFLSQKTISLVRQGMIESCSTGGVAWPLFEFKVKS